MKKNKLVALLLSLSWLVIAACSSQQPGVQIPTEAAVEPERVSDENMIAVDSGLKISAWAELSSSKPSNSQVELIRNNHIVSRSLIQPGKAEIPKNSVLVMELDLSRVREAYQPTDVHWKLQSSDGVVRVEKKDDGPRSGKSITSRFNVNFDDEFTVTFSLKKQGTILFKETIDFSMAPPPTIDISQPTNDIIVTYGEPVKFVANALDGAGNFPTVVWVVKTDRVERILGIGAEIESDRLDMGYNTVYAVAVDIRGEILAAKPVHVMIPYKAIETKIETPRDGQKFEWDQPVLFFALGNNLEYALIGPDAPKGDPSFFKGSGFIRPSLPAGDYRIIFKGEFGTATHTFKIRQKRSFVADVARVKGKVLMSSERGKWDPVQTGDKIPEGYILRAVDNGAAEIHLKNGVVYMLNRGKAIRILENGNIVNNLPQEDLALYSLVDPESIREVEANLKPMISQLRRLLKNHDIIELESENKEDIIRLLDMIFKGQLKIEEVTVD